MKWHVVEANYSQTSSLGHRAVKDTFISSAKDAVYSSAFEWHLFYPDRPIEQTRNPDKVFPRLAELKEYVRDHPHRKARD